MVRGHALTPRSNISRNKRLLMLARLFQNTSIQICMYTDSNPSKIQRSKPTLSLDPGDTPLLFCPGLITSIFPMLTSFSGQPVPDWGSPSFLACSCPRPVTISNLSGHDRRQGLLPSFHASSHQQKKTQGSQSFQKLDNSDLPSRSP